jgi:CrcB protein
VTDEHERRLPHDPDLEVDEDPTGAPLPVHLTPHLVALVFVGGSLGVLARAALDRWFPEGNGFPTTTFGINIVGALALAVLIEALALRGSDSGHRRALRLLAGTGLLGGFTTYSALAVHTDQLVRAGQMPSALTYSVGTVVVGFVASVVGIALTRRALAR